MGQAFSAQELTFIVKMKDGMTPSVKVMGASTKQLGQQFQKVDKEIRGGFLESLKKLNIATIASAGGIARLRVAAYGLSGAFAGLFAASKAKTALFDAAYIEEQLANVKALTDASESDLEMYKDSFSGIIGETGRSARELTDALYSINSAGAVGAEAVDILEKSAKAATAGLGETAVIGKTLAAVLYNFGDAGMTADEALGLMIEGARQGNFEVAELSSSISNVLPLAKVLGVSFGDVNAGVAVLTRSGQSASQAVTSLRSILVQLNRASPQAAEALRGTGVSMDDLRTTLREKGLLAALQQLDEAVGHNGQRMGLVIQDVEGLNGAMAILKSNVADTTRIFDVLSEKAAGKLEEVFGTKVKTTISQTRILVNSLANDMIQFADSVLPAVNAALVGLNSALKLVREIVKGVADTMIIWGPVVLGLALSHIPALTKSLLVSSGILKAYQALLISSAILGMGPFAGAVVFATGAVKAFTIALLANPFGLLAVGIAAAIGLLITFHKDLNSITDVTNALRAGFAGLVHDVKMMFQDIIQTIALGIAKAKFTVNDAFGKEIFNEDAIIQKYSNVITNTAKARAEAEAALEAEIKKLAGLSDPTKPGSKTDPLAQPDVVSPYDPEGSKELENMIKNRRKEVEALLQKNEALRMVLSGEEKELDIAELRIELRKTENTEMRKLIETQIKAQQEQRRLNEQYEQMKQLSKDITSAFSDTFKSIIMGSESARDALAKLASKLADIAFEAAMAPLQKSAGSFFTSMFAGMLGSARGNVFNNGNVQAYAQGGVVGGPTFFPLKGGKTGVMGEAGAEAILPLTRMPGGNLGVQAAGMGGGTTLNYSPSFQFVLEGGGGGKDGGNNSAGELEKLQKNLDNSIRRTVIEVLEDQKRIGNSLNRGVRV